MKTSMKGTFGYNHTLAVLVVAAVIAILSPVITFGCGWIGGVILKYFVGNEIAAGMNLMFNTERFVPDFIPLACATLATIGKYFKSSQTNNERS